MPRLKEILEVICEAASQSKYLFQIKNSVSQALLDDDDDYDFISNMLRLQIFK